MTTPTLNGQVLGQAENAVRAVLGRVLAGTGLDYHQWVALNAAATGVPATQLVDRLVDGLKIDEATVREVLAALAVRDLIDPASLAPTPAGRSMHGTVSSTLGVVTTQLYGDVPEADLAVAGRVLTEVTARANALLPTL
jgi:hypothetical protein